MADIYKIIFGISLSILVSSAAEDVAITDFYVPPHVRVNEEALLQCPYDIKDQKLESVAWYFDEQEFYRYSVEPHGISKQVFQNASFIVDTDQSNDTQLFLTNIKLSATGNYRCKIHTDAPHFETDMKERRMEVIVIPNDPPKLQNVPKKYLRPGARIRVNCISAPSIPAATVTFQINKINLPHTYVRSSKSQTARGLYVTEATLEMVLKRMYFKNGKANITCSSMIKTQESISNKLIVKSAAMSYSTVFTAMIVVMLTVFFR